MKPSGNAANRYRTTKDIIIPKGSHVIFVAHIREEAYRLAKAMVRPHPDMLYEWTMNYDDALKAGLIEKIE